MKQLALLFSILFLSFQGICQQQVESPVYVPRLETAFILGEDLTNECNPTTFVAEIDFDEYYYPSIGDEIYIKLIDFRYYTDSDGDKGPLPIWVIDYSLGNTEHETIQVKVVDFLWYFEQ